MSVFLRWVASVATLPLPFPGISSQPNNVSFHVDQDTFHKFIAFGFAGFGLGEIIHRHTAV